MPGIVADSPITKDKGVSKNRGTPKSSIFNRVFHYKPSILGETPYFWKHPYGNYMELQYIEVPDLSYHLKDSILLTDNFLASDWTRA